MRCDPSALAFFDPVSGGVIRRRHLRHQQALRLPRTTTPAPTPHGLLRGRSVLRRPTGRWRGGDDARSSSGPAAGRGCSSPSRRWTVALVDGELDGERPRRPLDGGARLEGRRRTTPSTCRRIERARCAHGLVHPNCSTWSRSTVAPMPSSSGVRLDVLSEHHRGIPPTVYRFDRSVDRNFAMLAPASRRCGVATGHSLFSADLSSGSVVAAGRAGQVVRSALPGTCRCIHSSRLWRSSRVSAIVVGRKGFGLPAVAWVAIGRPALIPSGSAAMWRRLLPVGSRWRGVASRHQGRQRRQADEERWTVEDLTLM